MRGIDDGQNRTAHFPESGSEKSLNLESFSPLDMTSWRVGPRRETTTN